MRRAVVIVTSVLLPLAACGTSATVVRDEPPATPYAGPMRVKQDFADDATVWERSGAAGLALECDGTPYAGGAGDYDSGLESVQGSPADALGDWLDNEAWAYQLPETGYRVERDADDRVLLSYDVAGRTKIAFVATDVVRDFDDDEGWGIESWSQCDPAELPAAVTDALGIGVWEDESGARVPVTRIRSFQGPEHCDWQDITFLSLDGRAGREQFLRDVKGEFDGWLYTTYDADAALPDDATETGLRRDGRILWLGPRRRAAYLVSADQPADVERWPAAREPVACA